jgi:hypothetical protein
MSRSWFTAYLNPRPLHCFLFFVEAIIAISTIKYFPEGFPGASSNTKTIFSPASSFYRNVISFAFRTPKASLYSALTHVAIIVRGVYAYILILGRVLRTNSNTQDTRALEIRIHHHVFPVCLFCGRYGCNWCIYPFLFWESAPGLNPCSIVPKFVKS